MKISLLSTLIVAALSASIAHAQDAGTISRQAEQTSVFAPNQTVSLPAIQKSNASDDNTPIYVAQVQLSGNQALSTNHFSALLGQYANQKLTLAQLHQLSEQIAQIYHQAGYPLAVAIIPAQRLENNVVIMQIIEGQLSDIKINNQSRLPDNVIQGHLHKAIATHEPLKQADSERALLLLKDLAGTNDVHYRLSADAKGTILVADLSKAPLMDGFVNIDNEGSASTGIWRTRAGVNFNSPLGLGEKIAIQAMTSLKGVNHARLSVDMPFGYDGLHVGAGLAHTRYALGATFKNLNATGKANVLDVYARYPILRTNRQNLWLTGTGEYRALKDIIGATNTQTNKRLQNLQIAVNGNHHLHNDTQLQWRSNLTLGNLTIINADSKAIDAASGKTAGSYYKLTGSVASSTPMAPKLRLHSELKAQWANKNLDSAEQISLGGMDNVSAYNSNHLSADRALIGQAQVRYVANPMLSLSAFYDVAIGKIKVNPYTQDKNTQSLSGAGIGLNSQYQNLSIQSKLAWQLGKHTTNKPQWWLKAEWQF